MAKFIRLPETIADDGLDFTKGREEIKQFWPFVLAMAVRDGANSLHWHPWLLGRAHSYVVGDTRYLIMPPPPEFDDQTFVAARSFISSSGFKLLAKRLFGLPITGRIRCCSIWGWSEWNGIAWTVGDQQNVDFFRVDLPRTPITYGGQTAEMTRSDQTK